MPVNVTNGTTAPTLPKPEAMIGANGLPLLAYQPDYLRDFLIGGFTIDASKIPPDSDGRKWAYAGDVFRRNDGTGLWDLVSGTADAGDGEKYVMLPHNRDCTGGNQSANGLIRSQHVNRGAVKRTIPTALVGPGKQFEYMYSSPLDLRV